MKVRQEEDECDKVETPDRMFELDILLEEHIKIKESDISKESKQSHDCLIAEIKKFYKWVPDKFNKGCARAIMRTPGLPSEVA
jgi:hypothetical protein